MGDMGCLKSIYEMSMSTHKLERLLVRLLILITITNINHGNPERDMGCLKSIYKISKSITPGGAGSFCF